MSGAHVNRAHVGRADADRADVNRVDVNRVDVNWVDVNWADVSGADVSGADVSGADVSGADTRRVDIGGRDVGLVGTSEGPARDGARLHVDWTRCRGRGLCAELLPELLERDEWGLPRAHGGGPTTDVTVPGELAGPARQAVRDCPRLALRLIGR